MNKINGKMIKSVYLGLSVLESSKAFMYEFWNNNIKPSINTMQNYATWMQTALLFILRCL